jgi:hypothetical protein
MRSPLKVRSTAGAALFVLVAWSHRGEAQALQFYNLTPCRAVDTRTGFSGIVVASTARAFQMKGVCGVPLDAKTVTLNVTIVGPTQGGFVFLWSAGTSAPLVSNINFNAGEPAIANGAVVPVAVSNPDLWLGYGTATGGGTTHAILDVTGYFK